MPSQKSKFPSYGLVRGPSHEQGGVAGMVADEQPVELEGGEWIIPKEAVPDYLPALIQMTNTGRMRQAMQNGNSAMDALIASASMQTGLAQPKSPMYQEGGEVYANKKVIPYQAGKKEQLYGSDKSAEEQRDIIAQRMTYPGDTFFRPSAGPASGIGAFKGVGLNLLLNSLTGGATSGYNALAALIGAGREIKRMGSDKTQIKRMTEGKQPFDPVYFRKDYETGDVYSATRKGWRKLAPKAVSAMEENFPDYMGNIEAYNTGYSYRKKQGGPVYQEGGEIDYSKTSGLYNRFLAEQDSPEIMEMKDILLYRAMQNPETTSAELSDKQSDIGRQFSKDALLTKALLSRVGMEGATESDSLSLVNALSPAGRRLYENIYATPKRQGGKIEYEDGGRVSVKSKLIDVMSESNGLPKGYTRSDLETLDLDTLERLQSTMMERNIGDQYGGIEDVLVSKPGSANIGAKRTYANRFDVAEEFGPEGRVGTATEQLNLGSLPGLAAISNLASRAGVNPESAIGRVLNAPLPIQRTADIGTGDVSYALTRRQGGPVDYYQTGGQVQPRKQQEIRNPAMYYGPPIELMGPDSSAYNEAQSEFEAFMDSLETKRNTNPFSGKPMDTDADVKRLLERMKQSKIPRSGQRMIMRQGGPIPYQNGGEIPDARMMRPSPEAQERLLNDLRAQGAIMGDNPGDRGGYFPLASQVEPDALMGTIRSDRRIKPLEPDIYIQRIPNAGRFDKSGMQFPVYQEEVSQVPKLSTAYLASFGMETPLSREQQALLQRKMIAPETLNPKVKGLINRALVQRLANEED